MKIAGVLFFLLLLGTLGFFFLKNYKSTTEVVKPEIVSTPEIQTPIPEKAAIPVSKSGDELLRSGILKKNSGDYAGAIKDWGLASQIPPRNFVAFENLGDLYANYLKDFPKAEANFKKAIAIEPAFEEAYLALSNLYRYSYKERETLVDDILLEGLKANPASYTISVTLAAYYEEKGDKADAIKYYEKALEIQPQSPEAARALSELKASM